MQRKWNARCQLLSAFVALALMATMLPLYAAAQDRDNDDPPGRAARLGHMDGSISFQPAGESEWVEAVPNRPMTTGDKLWADRDSRAEVELGSTSIHLSSNTGFSFLNLDDRTVQIQLSSGVINVRVRRLDRDDVFEIDTPNQAFSIFQPGRYRFEASEDGTYSVVTVREGEGESTGNGQTYSVHAGIRATFSGTDRLNADFEQLGDPDDFDNWSYGRDRRFEQSRSARYVSPDVVGADDLDDYGDWQPAPEYGNVWYPRVEAGWAPYHTGHWAWIDPWGWTWVDEAPWGYAPFHYGRWAFIRNRWGWIPGPIEVRPVYAPALVVFVGGGGPGFGGNVAWFALGPREVYVPSYRVSPAYVNRVNISNTTVNQTTVTNVYNTTIVNKTTVINNVTYVNRGVSGAVTAQPQQAFAGGQSVTRTAVRVNAQQIAAAPVTARVPVAPAQTAVLGLHANTANRVAAPPQAVANRPMVAKVAPPPPPVSFAAKQKVLTANPGQPVARQEMQRLRPANVPAAQPLVRQAPPGKPATATVGRPGTQPTPQPNAPANQPGNQPGNRPGNPAANERPGMTPPANRPQPNQPTNPAANQPNQPAPNQPSTNRPFQPPARNDRPPTAQPNNRPEANTPTPNQPQPGRPAEPNRPNQPPARNDQPSAAQPENRPANQPQPGRPAEPNRPNQPPARNEQPTAQPENRPPNQPQPGRPAEQNRPYQPPARNNQPPAAQPENRPNQPQPGRPAEQNRPAEPPARNERPPQQPQMNRPTQPSQPPQNTRPAEPPPRQQEPQQRQQTPPPNDRPPQRTPPPAETRPPQNQQRQQPQKPMTPEEKKRQQEEEKKKPQ